MADFTSLMPDSGKVYQFTRFDNYTVQSLICGKAYYADHTQFNDSFDCDIGLRNTLSSEKLQELAETLDTRNNTLNETMLALYRGVKDPEEIIELRVADIRDGVRLLMKDTGVLCLTERYDSTLMWAHYAEKHRGLCLEYDVYEGGGPVSNFRRVDYENSSVIDIRLVYKAVMEDCASAKAELVDAYFFRKTADWDYEKEWRALRPKISMACPPGKLTGIHFGMRCPAEIVEAVLRIYGKCQESPGFYRMEPIKALEAERSRRLRRVPLSGRELRCLERPLPAWHKRVHEDALLAKIRPIL